MSRSMLCYEVDSEPGTDRQGNREVRVVPFFIHQPPPNPTNFAYERERWSLFGLIYERKTLINKERSR